MVIYNARSVWMHLLYISVRQITRKMMIFYYYFGTGRTDPLISQDTRHIMFCKELRLPT